MTELLPFLAGIALYALLLVSIAVATQPMRRRLTLLATEMMDEPGRSKAEIEELDRLIWTSMSSKVAFFVPVAAVSLIVDILLRRSLSHQPALRRLHDDPRFGEIAALYMGSVMLMSPIVSLLSLPIHAVGIATALHHNEAKSAWSVVEEPVLRASARMRSAAC